MKSHTKIYLGSILSLIGSTLILYVIFKGSPDLGSPWTFLAGFLNGIMAGTGAVLVIAGLVEKRKEEAKK